jgi:hypothetical protein
MGMMEGVDFGTEKGRGALRLRVYLREAKRNQSHSSSCIETLPT